MDRTDKPLSIVTGVGVDVEIGHLLGVLFQPVLVSGEQLLHGPGSPLKVNLFQVSKGSFGVSDNNLALNGKLPF